MASFVMSCATDSIASSKCARIPSTWAPGMTATSSRPTKLFIGGISRNTTTPMLRDHFSRHGRVLDCVAMRQPDGRSRGFGYVTLDSRAAAERFLMEPQSIDGRIVDMKLAVPEGSGSKDFHDAATASLPVGSLDYSSIMAMSGVDHFSLIHDPFYGCMGPGMLPGGLGPWWSGLDAVSLNACASALAGGDAYARVPDCVDVLINTRKSPKFGGSFVPFEDCVMSPIGKMTANAPEFVPWGQETALAPKLILSSAPPTSADKAVLDVAEKKVKTRKPLGELTNLTSPNLIEDKKGFALTAKANNTMDLVLQELHQDHHTVKAAKPTLAIPIESKATIASTVTASASEFKIFEDRGVKSDFIVRPVSVVENAVQQDDMESSQGDSELCCTAERPSESEGDSYPAELYSTGSALHAQGECKRCNFFVKGRCQNGTNCEFCHLPHEKRKLTRQEKRERQAAWLQGGQQEILQQLEQEKVDASHDTYILPTFLGLPPKLVSSFSQSRVDLPPGLPAPQVLNLEAPQWQPDAELSPSSPLLSTSPPSQGCQVPGLSSMTNALLHYSMHAEAMAVFEVDRESTRAGGTCEMGTQTEVPKQVEASKTDEGSECCWSRESLLSVRSAMDAVGVLEENIEHQFVWRAKVMR